MKPQGAPSRDPRSQSTPVCKRQLLRGRDQVWGRHHFCSLAVFRIMKASLSQPTRPNSPSSIKNIGSCLEHHHQQDLPQNTITETLPHTSTLPPRNTTNLKIDSLPYREPTCACIAGITPRVLRMITRLSDPNGDTDDCKVEESPKDRRYPSAGIPWSNHCNLERSTDLPAIAPNFSTTKTITAPTLSIQRGDGARLRIQLTVNRIAEAVGGIDWRWSGLLSDPGIARLRVSWSIECLNSTGAVELVVLSRAEFC
jgi:hypothetical protein